MFAIASVADPGLVWFSGIGLYIALSFREAQRVAELVFAFVFAARCEKSCCVRLTSVIRLCRTFCLDCVGYPLHFL